MRKALESHGGVREDSGMAPAWTLCVIGALVHSFALFQGGERFDKVAQEYSEDKAKGLPSLFLLLSGEGLVLTTYDSGW